MASFRSFIVGLILLGLFVLSIGNFIVTTQLNNGVNDTILNDPSFNATFTSIETDLGKVQDQGQAQRQGLEEENPTKGSDNLIFDSIGGIKRFTGTVVSISDLTFGLIASTIGVSPLVLSVFLGMILIIGGILFWRVIRSGD